MKPLYLTPGMGLSFKKGGETYGQYIAGMSSNYAEYVSDPAKPVPYVPRPVRWGLSPRADRRAARARARQRFFLAPNNYIYGGIRLNLAGREPEGRVAADEVDTLCARLERDLKTLVNPETGEAVVRRLVRANGL